MGKKRVYYIFNPDTRTYDRVYPNFAQKFLTLVRRCVYYIIFGGLSFLLFSLIFDRPGAQEYQHENSQLLAQYQILSERLDRALIDIIEILGKI